MKQSEAMTIVMGLSAETREAVALFIEGSYDRYKERWDGPGDVSLYEIAQEVRDGKPYVYEPPLPVYGCKTEDEQRMADIAAGFLREQSQYYSTFMLTRENVISSSEPVINWNVRGLRENSDGR